MAEIIEGALFLAEVTGNASAATDAAGAALTAHGFAQEMSDVNKGRNAKKLLNNMQPQQQHPLYLFQKPDPKLEWASGFCTNCICGKKFTRNTLCTGSFYCPICNEEEQKYTMKQMFLKCHWYYIPLCCAKDLGIYVKCTKCKNHFDSGVLDIPSKHGSTQFPKKKKSIGSGVSSSSTVTVTDTITLPDGSIKASITTFTKGKTGVSSPWTKSSWNVFSSNVDETVVSSMIGKTDVVISRPRRKNDIAINKWYESKGASNPCADNNETLPSITSMKEGLKRIETGHFTTVPQ